MSPKLEVLAQIFQIFSVFIGILLIWWQIRTQNKLTSAQLYVSLEERYNDPNHREMRRQTAKAVLAFVNGGDVEDLPGNIPIFSLLESCGELSLRGAMRHGEINAGFGYYTFGYVYLAMHGRPGKNFIELERKDQDEAWAGMEYICTRYIEKNRRHLLTHAKKLEIALEAIRKELRA